MSAANVLKYIKEKDAATALGCKVGAIVKSLLF